MLSSSLGDVVVNSLVNSTTTPLAANATFTGTGELNSLGGLLVTAKSDVAGTLYVDFSTDGGTNYDSTISYAVAAGVYEIHTLVKGFRTARVRYINGSTIQSYFRLHTEYGEYRQLTLGLASPVQQDADASTVRAISEETAIAGGLFTGYSIVNKFGRNPDIDVATVPEDVWPNGGAYTGFPDSDAETISVFSDSASDAAAGTGARTVQLMGLNSSYDAVSETVTLNGTSAVASSTVFRRMHSMTVLTAGSGGVNAGTITARHTTTTANVFGSITPGLNQGYTSAYTVPAGYTAYMRRLHVNIRVATTAVAADGFVWTRAFGGAYRGRRPFSANNAAPVRDEIFGGLVFTEKSDIIMRITAVSANNQDVTAGYDLIVVKNNGNGS